MPRRGSSRTRLRDHDLVVVIGAPVFTFHVEGHASIFDGATTIFQITDDPTAAAVTPVGTSIIATMKPALAMLLDLAARDQTRDAGGPRACRRHRPPGDPIPAEYPAARALDRDARRRHAGGGSPVAPAGDAEVHADARAGQFLHHGERRPRLRPAGLGRHRARPPRPPDRLPDRRRLGDVFDPGACGPRRNASCR